MATKVSAPARPGRKPRLLLEGLALAGLLILPVLLYRAAPSGNALATGLLLGLMALLMVGLIILE